MSGYGGLRLVGSKPASLKGKGWRLWDFRALGPDDSRKCFALDPNIEP